MGIKKTLIPKTPLSDRPTVNNTDGFKFEREIEPVSGSTGSGDVDQGPIWFSRNPAIVFANTSGVSVKATVGIDTDAYASSSQWWGIWPTTSTPSDADVKAGTGALATGSGSYAHLATVTDTLSSVSLTVNTAYTLHWLAEAGAAETLVSARAPGVTFTVQNSPPIGKPSIDGVLTVGETLTCNTSGISDFDTIATPFTCFWYASGVLFDSPAEGVMTTTLTESEKNKTITVAVTYTDGNGINEGPIESSGYGPVQAINYPPTGSLVITGQTTVDQWLTASQGTFDDANGYFTASVTTHWRYGDAGQEYIGTGNPYQVKTADIGRTLQVGVSYVDGDNFVEPPTGIAHWDSTPTDAVVDKNHAPSGLLAISGDTYQVPQWVQAEQGTLTDDNGLPDLNDAGKWQWQWQWSTGADIDGANSRQYQLQNTDAGKRLKVSAVYIDDHGYSNNAESQSTQPISAAPPTGEFLHDFSTYFLNYGLGPFNFTRANSDSCVDYTAASQQVGTDIPLMTGDRWDGSTWQNESVGYGIELEPGATEGDVGDLQAPLANLPGLPPEGLTDNYAIQLTLTLRDDLANLNDPAYFFEAVNVVGGSPGDQAVRAYATGATGVVIEVVVDAVPHPLTFADAAVTGATIGQRFDVRARKDGTGLTAWLYVDGALVAKQVDGTASAPHAVAIDKIDIGSQADDTAVFTMGVPPATLAPAQYQFIRIEPDTTALSDEDIEGWDTWSEPTPVLVDVDPPYLHFGEGEGPITPDDDIIWSSNFSEYAVKRYGDESTDWTMYDGGTAAWSYATDIAPFMQWDGTPTTGSGAKNRTNYDQGGLRTRVSPYNYSENYDPPAYRHLIDVFDDPDPDPETNQGRLMKMRAGATNFAQTGVIDNKTEDLHLSISVDDPGNPGNKWGYDELYIRFRFKYSDDHNVANETFPQGQATAGPPRPEGYDKWLRLRCNTEGATQGQEGDWQRQVIVSGPGANFEDASAGGMSLTANTNFWLRDQTNNNDPTLTLSFPEPSDVTPAAHGLKPFRLGSQDPDGEGQPGNCLFTYDDSGTDWDNHGHFANRNQRFHTVEFRIKMATTQTSNDGVFQVWFNGVEQLQGEKTEGGPSEYDGVLSYLSTPLNGNPHSQITKVGHEYTMDAQAFSDNYAVANNDTLAHPVRGLPTAAHPDGAIGWSVIYLEGNFQRCTSYWHDPGADGGKTYSDIVISKSRIGPDYVAKNIDNRKKFKDEGQP